MSKLDNIREQIRNAENKMVELNEEITSLDDQALEESNLGNYNRVTKLQKKIRKQSDLLEKVRSSLEVFRVNLRNAELEQNKKEVASIIKEIDNRVPKELALISREFKHGISSILKAEERFRELRPWYNEMKGKAVKIDEDMANRLLLPYDNYDWTFGEAEMTRWLSESLGLFKDSKKYVGLVAKIYSNLKLRDGQIADVQRFTKGRK